MENLHNVISLVGGLSGLLFVIFLVRQIIKLRIVVPTDKTHIVQSNNGSSIYGGKVDSNEKKSNVYYNWPSWIPKLGVVTTVISMANFNIDLDDYDAFDSSRKPFKADVKAFFRIFDPIMASQRIENEHIFKAQIKSIVEGAVRKVFASSKLEVMLEARSTLSDEITSEITEELKSWGVEPVKSVAIMDFRDSKDSKIISQIQQVDASRIDKETRIVIAENQQEASNKEILTRKSIELNKQAAEREIQQQQVENTKAINLTNEISKQEVLAQAKLTMENEMNVRLVNETKQAEIEKEVTLIESQKQLEQAEIDKKTAIVKSEQTRQQVEIAAAADLKAAELNATAIATTGKAKAEAEYQWLNAPIKNQIELAEAIGNNQGYQNYLINNKYVEASVEQTKYNAEALKSANLSVIVNEGSVQGGMESLGGILSSKGGTNLNGLLAGIGATEVGGNLIKMLQSNKQPQIDGSQQING